MAVSVTKNSGNTIFTFTITATSTKLDPILDKWAKYIWYNGYGDADQDGNLIDYTVATNQQKFGALNRRIKDFGLSEANARESIDAHAEVQVTVHDLASVS